MHFKCSVPKREGIYHIRLYDIDLTGQWLFMETHARGINPGTDGLFAPDGRDKGIPVHGDLVYEQGFGDMQSANDNELLQGAIQHENFKISLEADPVMADLVASWRNLKKEIWCEITLEQHAENIPALIPLDHVQPRKERSMFWGRLVRNEASGYVDYQKYKKDKNGNNTGLVRDSETHIHVGGLDMTFVHWLHIRLAMSCASDLKAYRDAIVLPGNPHHSAFDYITTPVAPLLMMLAVKSSATQLVSAVDHHFSEKPYFFPIFNADVDPSNCNIELKYQLIGDSNNIAFFLGEVEIPLYLYDNSGLGPSRYTFIWNYDSTAAADHGPYSLFTRWKTYGDAMLSLGNEFFLRFDQEIPLLKEVLYINRNPDGNTQANRIAHWNAVTRWAFVNVDAVEEEIVLLPIEKSVKYNPCAVWVSHIKISEPNPANFINTNWVNSDVEYFNLIPEGKDITYATLFRFVGKAFRGGGGAAAEFNGGAELYVNGKVFTGLGPARTATFDGVTVYDQWNKFQLYNRVNLWGGARAMVELDHQKVGVTPFGGVTNDFGFMDYGDYGNLRRFDASPGLLYSGSQYAHFSVIEIKRTPGGNSHIKGIERIVLQPVDIPIPPVTPPPPPPVIKLPPPPPAEPICGDITFTFGVLYPNGCVSKADVYIDGVLYGTVSTFPDPMPEGIVPVTIFIATCNYSNGLHTITITLTLCDGSMVSAVWSFTVNCPCTGANTTLKVFSY